MAFGNKMASDAREASGDWIRRFNDGETQIRILPMEAHNVAGKKVVGAESWPQEREHFDNNLRIAFPCTGDNTCIGCNHEDKKVREKSAKVYFVALDEEGEPRLYKIGRKLYKSLRAKEQRLLTKNPQTSQPLSERDYIIIRSGSGFDTEYEAEAGEVYEVEVPDEYPSLDDALMEAYNDAAEMYGEEPIEVEEEEEPPARKRAAKKAPAKARKTARKPEPEPEDDEDEEEEEPAKPARKRATKKAAASKKSEPVEADDDEEDEEEPEGLPTEPSDDDITEASTGELRDWLTSKDVEFPPRAPRRRLVEIALDAPRY